MKGAAPNQLETTLNYLGEENLRTVEAWQAFHPDFIINREP